MANGFDFFIPVAILIFDSGFCMQRSIWPGREKEIGRLPWAERDRCFPRNGVNLARLILIFPFVLATTALAGDIPLGFGWQNLEFRTYAPNSIREIADCKIGKIFLDHRKLGFFRVKLLPVLVVQGVQVELADANPTNDWAESFQSDWLPDVKRSAVEWRDVTITVQRENAPRLHADRAQPAAGGSPTICSFKEVTLEANGAKWHLAQAELRNEDRRPRVVWHAAGGETQHLDLFSGEIFNNSKFNGEKQ